jgi:hypothetical protein
MVPAMGADSGAERRSQQAQSIGLLVGLKLEYVRLGHAIVLSFTDGSQVLIETVVHLDGPNGRVDVEPGDNPSDVLATLLGDVVRAASIRDSGELEITFGGGAQVVVGVDAEVEAWAFAGRDGMLMVCLARGELAVWTRHGVQVGGPPSARSAPLGGRDRA